jgi:DNA primase large subunit
LELRYPFAPQSRKFFETIPVEEGLASREVVGQAESRLLNALGRAKYERHMSELIEFSSFFAAALIASQEGFLASKFSKKEAERAKEFFVREGRREKATVMNECFGVAMELAEEGRGVAEYTMPFESYLTVATRYELTKVPKWKLVRQALVGGAVFFSDNLLNDLFVECAQGAISEGVKNLRRGVFPRQLQAARANIIQYVPVQRPRGGQELPLRRRFACSPRLRW